MKNANTKPASTAQLSPAECKLLKQIQSQAKPPRSLVRFLSTTACGFHW